VQPIEISRVFWIEDFGLWSEGMALRRTGLNASLNAAAIGVLGSIGFALGLFSFSLPVAAQKVIDLDDPTTSAPTGFAQVPMVGELTDVKPTDWAYQAVQAIVNRYGFMRGDGQGKFRGNAPMTRYEFSAALAELMQSLAPIATEDDVKLLRQLQEVYDEALKKVRSRLDGLENTETTLSTSQFSTTTKFRGQSDQIITDGTSDSKMSVVSRFRLSLDTSFTGKDLLVMQLQSGNNGLDAIGLNQQRQGDRLSVGGTVANGGGLDAVSVDPKLRIRKLYYTFPVSNTVQLTVGSAIPPSDFIDRNTFANNSGQNFASSFFMNNPLIVQNPVERASGAGVVIQWTPSKVLTVRGLLAGAGGNDPSIGLFRDPYQITLEGEYRLPTRPIILRAQYTNGNVANGSVNAIGLNGEWMISRQAGAFGRIGLANYSGVRSGLTSEINGTPFSWAFGGILRNFVIPGSKAGFAIGQPFVGALGNATQTNAEAYFGLLINDRINFSPSLLYVMNPDNQRAPSILQWALRMTFDF
jgi:Carbohydrate-selective porin, OprB family/S-layer homology domain